MKLLYPLSKSSNSPVKLYPKFSFELSSNSSYSSSKSLPFFVYCVFNHPSDIWKEFSEEEDGFNRNMPLSTFLETQKDLLGSKFVTGVLVPAVHLGWVDFQYSHEYEQCTSSTTLGHIMEQGGVCLVFKCMAICVHSTPLFLTIHSIDQHEAFLKCVDATPSAFHLICQNMRQNNLDDSYLDLRIPDGWPYEFHALCAIRLQHFSIDWQTARLCSCREATNGEQERLATLESRGM